MATFKERIQSGKCGRCGVNNITPPIKQCQACLDKLKVYASKNRSLKREKGCCLGCGIKNEGAYCQSCQKTIKDWNTANKKSNDYSRKYREKIRNKVLDHYGCVCICCGERSPYFLTIDHIHNDGADHRRQIGRTSTLCRWIVKNNYPEGFQILCWNCNYGKHLFGKCPHQLKDN